MFNSEEEFVMEFKAEDKIAQLEMFDTNHIDSDSITISASEIESDGCNSPTPPLFCKLKKVRVAMKKLPRNILTKESCKNKKSSFSSVLQPSRSSGRIKDKEIPFGQYLALHVNKPLNEVLNNKRNKKRSSQRIKDKEIPFGKYLALHMNKPLKEVLNKKKIFEECQMKTAEKKKIVKKKKVIQNKKQFKFTRKPNRSLKMPLGTANLNKSLNNGKAASEKKSSTVQISLPTRRNLYEEIVPENQIKVNELVTPALPNSTGVNLTTNISSADRRSLQEKVAATRLRTNAVTSILPNFPDVVITKYDIPPNASVNILPHFASATMENNYIRNSITVSRPQHHINVQMPLPFESTNFLHSQSISRNLPKQTAPGTSHQQIPSESVVSNAATTVSSTGSFHQNNSTRRTLIVKAFQIPHKLSAANDPVAVNSSKDFSVNQPSLPSDPLDMTRSKKMDKMEMKQHIHTDNYADSDTVTCAESESDLELSDNENQSGPEVIKRIIYHTKSVQTRFTCNSSICGLIDSDEFNLNCFYCYDIFPLHKWLEFKEHIKLVHHVEEKENHLDSEADASNYNAQECHQISSHHSPNVTRTINPISKSINYKDIALKKENFTTIGLNTTEQASKKLPLEPRLVAQRLNKTSAVSVKLLSSTPKTSHQPFKQLNQSVVSGKSSRRKLSNDSHIGEIISIDSDDCDLDIQDIDDVTKNATRDPQPDSITTNNQAYMKNRPSEINDVKVVVPAVPHIKVKKFDRFLPKESINAQKPATKSTNLKEQFIKLPSNFNIHKVIKTLPKPKAQKLSENGRIRPRYFVVKKIIKLPTTDTVSNLNISKGMILTKMQVSEKVNSKKRDYDEMLSNNENEDSVPKPTNGCGLKTYPELWRSQLKNNESVDYNGSIKKLCSHLNGRFGLSITEIEIRKSIQRIKNWYYRILRNMYEHSKTPNTAPYKHNFPIYFKILQNFLTPDVQAANALNNTNVNNDVICKTGTQAVEQKPIRIFSATPVVAPPTNIDNNKIIERCAESLIEFDADTLYDNESSDEEVLEEFDETKHLKKKISRLDGKQKKRTKVYIGSYECDICRKTFKRTCDLKRHKIMHFPPQFVCGICSKKFYFKHWAERCSHISNKKYKKVEKNIDPHMPKRIWPKKIFRFNMICEICGASYRSIGSLNTHKRDKHLNQRHKCVVCNFTALSNWRIVQHQKKRHIVEPGTVEEIAKKSRPRTDTKTPFSNEARQGFFWRLEMRKQLKPGEKFYGCCRCKIIFNSRKEKVLHNKIEHPITETTVICLLCLPNNKLLLSNSNCARRHYTDIHRVAWHEIDGLVKRTKPIFKLLSKEEIELLKASENYKELLEELLKDKKLEPAKNVQTTEDETLKAVQNLPTSLIVKELEEEVNKIDVESTQDENVYVDGIVDHDYNCWESFNQQAYAYNNEHNYSEEKETIENDEVVDNQVKNELYSQHSSYGGSAHLVYDFANNNNKTNNYLYNDQKYVQNVDDFVEGELVEESIVVEEYIDEVIEEEEQEYF